MKKVTFFAAAVAVSALVAAPALAQDSTQSRKAPTSKHMSMHKSHQHMRHHSARHDRMTARDNWDRRDTGFWPGAVAGGIVGGAVGTAGAIATAPFGGPRDYAYRDSYAYGPMGYDVGYKYDGIAMPQSSNYAARNGFVCQPGTVTRPANGSGIPLICQ